MPAKPKETTVKYEPHKDYKPLKDNIEYALMVDGQFVISSQPASVAWEIIHCAAKTEKHDELGFDFRIVTPYGNEYLYHLSDFVEVEQD